MFNFSVLFAFTYLLLVLFIYVISDFMNRWRPYPKHKPNKRGWYICSIRYGDDPGQAYVMDLFWNDKLGRWQDNRRLNVFELYEVFGHKKNIIGNYEKRRIYNDSTCYRDDVIAFKKLPKIYK